MKTETVKGFEDYTGQEAEKRAVITGIVQNVFERYGFQPADTPVIEYEEFVRGENEKDEAVSDIFKLKDKGNRSLALRYEFTFQLKRLMQNKKLPFRRFEIGPVFRDEPVKGNRFRQFTTCEADIVGSSTKDEADVLAVVKTLLEKLKIDNVIYVNNRKLLNSIMDDVGVKEKDKLDVIREIDKLDKLPENEVKENLKKYGAEKIIDIFKKDSDYFKKYPSYLEIIELKKFCSYYGVKFVFAPYLARGLSYYNGTVFEVKTKRIKETICGGGAYMFNNVQCFGFGVSIERLSVVTNLIVDLEKYMIVSLNKDKEAIKLAEELRDKGKSIIMFYGKPSKALEYANSYNIKKVIFVGEKEVKEKKFKIKDMKSGKEILLKIREV
jgi:histidyl-tRNA synthetase